MKFGFVKRDTLPRSSWLAQVRRGEERIDVLHGSSVEAQGDLFFEGAWDGPFSAGAFDQAVTVLGSGGKVVSGGYPVFAAPSHIYERLYALRRGGELFVSNSLVFLLAQSGAELDEAGANYAKTLYRTYGVRAVDRSLPTREGDELRLFYCSNLVVRPDLEIEEVPKNVTPEFEDFGAYRDFLESSVARVFENAGDSNRAVKYVRPVAAISSGYDSTATAVLARSIGCRECVTFPEARPLAVDRYHGGPDSGKAIAERLGMTCTEVGRLDYLANGRQFPEAEIFATSHLVDLYILSLEKKLDDQAVLFTGFRGDVMWSKEVEDNQDSGGPGIAEFRLRLGFLHVPLPYLGTVDCQPRRCKVSRSIRRISNSKEMVPWSVEGAYDRPIPRRIVESAGVDRHAFGQMKRAVAVWYGKEPPEDIMKSDSYRDFEAFRSNIAGPEANQCFHWGVARTKGRYVL